MRIIWFCMVLAGLAVVADVEVKLAVESQDVALKEAFIFQVKVSNAKEPEAPVFPENADFRVRALRPSHNSSTQMSYVNGRRNMTVTDETIYSFQLTPLRKGTLSIPSLLVKADGKTFKTSRIPINVGDEMKVSGIGFELSLSADKCSEGENLVATWRLYIAQDVQDMVFDMPLLKDAEAFSMLVYEPKYDQRLSYKRMPNTADVDLVGELKRCTWHGMQAYVLEVSRPFQALKAGSYSLKAGSVTCQVADPRARRRQRSPFDFFDSIPMKTVTIEGNEVKLTVAPLPTTGQPPNFTGIIGQCGLRIEAKPLEVNVGDPIAVSLYLTGLPYPDNARIPPISRMGALAGNFRLSDEDTGTVQNGEKRFQFTLRALNDQVKEIPALSLPYYDSAKGAYASAESRPLALTVHAVKTVTASDVQGAVAALSSDHAPVGVEVKALEDGLAHNVAYQDILTNEEAGFRTWRPSDWRFLTCLGSVLAYLLAAGLTMLLAHRQSDPVILAARRNAEQALGRINGQGALSADELYAAVQDVLRWVAGLPAGALTYGDVEPRLRKKGVAEQVLEDVRRLFDAFEAASYSGGGADVDALRREARRLLKSLKK